VIVEVDGEYWHGLALKKEQLSECELKNQKELEKRL